MKRRRCIKIFGVIVTAGLMLGAGGGWSRAADLKVGLRLTDASGLVKNTFQLGEEIKAEVTLGNPGPGDVITRYGTRDRKVFLELHFTRYLPDGNKQLFTTLYPENLNEPQNPVKFLIDGVDRQVIPIEVFTAGTGFQYDPFNVLEFYKLDAPGKYSVKVVFGRMTFDEYFLSDNNAMYAQLEHILLSGDIESYPEIFFNIVADKDGDTFTNPEAYGAEPTTADCDDNNPAVNPGVTEIVGNGIDDDCSSITADEAVVEQGTILVEVQKLTVGRGSSKEPLPNVPMRVFSKSKGSCVWTNYGVPESYYDPIWWGCNPAVAQGKTGPDGLLSLGVPPGNYLLIGLYSDTYIGVSVGDVASGETVRKNLQVMEKK